MEGMARIRYLRPSMQSYDMGDTVEKLKKEIECAFANVAYPGDNRLRGSNEGSEPYLLEREFRGKSDWRRLDAGFIDQAPDGFASALSFFSAEAFQFYLPAYLVADLQGLLSMTDPVFYLCHGFDNSSRDEFVNPRRYGRKTWFDSRRARYGLFDEAQRRAISGYLRYKRDADKWNMYRTTIDEALTNYWEIP